MLGRETQTSELLFYKPFHSIGHLIKDIQRGGLRGNFIGNILLFIPVGLLTPMMTGWKKRTIAVGTGLSLLIEIVQLASHKGVFDPDDIILNTLGCMIGYFVLSAAVKLFTKTDLNADSNPIIRLDPCGQPELRRSGKEDMTT